MERTSKKFVVIRPPLTLENELDRVYDACWSETTRQHRVHDTALELLNEILNTKSCGANCDEKVLSAISYAYAGPLSEGIIEAFGVSYGKSDKTFILPRIRHSSDEALSIIYAKGNLPEECRNYISGLNERVTSKISEISIINDVGSHIPDLYTEYYQILVESLTGAKDFTIYAGHVGNEEIKKTAIRYFKVAEKCLSTYLLGLRLTNSLRDSLIEWYNEKILELKDFKYPLQFLYKT